MYYGIIKTKNPITKAMHAMPQVMTVSGFCIAPSQADNKRKALKEFRHVEDNNAQSGI